MGVAKVSLPLPTGEPMGVRIWRVIRDLCETVVLVGTVGEIPEGLHHLKTLPDLRSGRPGPLAGWEALLSSGVASDYLVVPCDLPKVTAALLSLLAAPPPGRAAALKVRRRDRVEPMPLRLPASALREVSAALDRGEHKAGDLLARLDPVEVALPAALEPELFNLNRPADLDDLRK